MVGQDLAGALRAPLTCLLILVLLLPAAPSEAGKRDFASDHKGDPGDGVLDPSVDTRDSGSSLTTVPDVTPRTFERLPFVLIPMPGPAGSGWPVVFRLVTPDAPAAGPSAGRWTHAP